MHQQVNINIGVMILFLVLDKKNVNITNCIRLSSIRISVLPLKISGLPGGPASSLEGSTEFDDSITMRETESSSVDLGYETLSTGPKKDDDAAATLHTED